METKKCTGCGQVKPISEFSWYKKGKIRQQKCKECFSKYNKERYARNKDKFKKDVSEYRKNNPISCFETRMRSFTKNPTRYNSRKVTEAAINCGLLKNPHVCENCGVKAPERRIEAHHSDYSQPLKISWLCTPCHRAFDGERRVLEGKKRSQTARPVVSFDKFGNKVKEYESIKDAAFDVNRDYACIRRAIKKKGFSAGLRWEYKNE